MSADAWDVCPHCAKKRREDLDAREAELAKGYGKMPPREWMEKRQSLDALQAKKQSQTVRLDYDVSMDRTELCVDAYAVCEVCHWTWHVKADTLGEQGT